MVMMERKEDQTFLNNQKENQQINNQTPIHTIFALIIFCTF